jgi:hypothetical protein
MAAMPVSSVPATCDKSRRGSVMADSSEEHGPTLQEVQRTIADHYGAGWLSARESALQELAATRAALTQAQQENTRLQEELDEQNGTTHALNLAAQVRQLQAENRELERHAGIAGEISQEANNHSVALRQEIAQVKRWGTELLVRELMARERAEAAEAQLTALQAEQAQWQQIETAPMTTERVVYVLISDGVCLPDIAVWKPERPERTSGGTRSLAIPAGWFGADGVRSRVTPTFWRPLPQLAALTAQQAENQKP